MCVTPPTHPYLCSVHYSSITRRSRAQVSRAAVDSVTDRCVCVCVCVLDSDRQVCVCVFEMDLKDKVAVVTGAAQGLGRSFVEILLKNGSKVK